MSPSWVACPDLWRFWPNKPLGCFSPKQNWRLHLGSHSCDSPVGWFQLFERFPTVLTFISSPINSFSVRLKTWFLIQDWSFLFFIIYLFIREFVCTQTRIHAVFVKGSRVYAGYFWHSRVCMLVAKLWSSVYLGRFWNFGFLEFSVLSVCGDLFLKCLCTLWIVKKVVFGLFSLSFDWKLVFLAKCCFWCWHFWFEYQDLFLSILGCSALSEQRAPAHLLFPIFVVRFALWFLLISWLVFLGSVG